MKHHDILQRLSSIFQDIFDDENLEITESTAASDIEDWDSLTHINLVSACENEFKLRFSLAELEDLKNVGDMITLIANKLG
jgi:acyl carrier protein